MIVNDLFEAVAPGGPRIPGLTNPTTGQDWSRDELLAPEEPDYAAIRKQKQKAAAAAAQAQMNANPAPAPIASKTPGQIRAEKLKAATTAANTPTAKKHTGGKVAGVLSQTPNAIRKRNQRAAKKQTATPPINQYAPVQSYSNVKMNAPTYAGVPSISTPVASTQAVKPAPIVKPGEKITIGGQAIPSHDPLYKKIIKTIQTTNSPSARKVKALAESINNIQSMLESVETKKDVVKIREYIDTTFEHPMYQDFRRALHEKVSTVSAIKRRIAAQQAAN